MSRLVFFGNSYAYKRKDGLSFTVVVESNNGNTFRQNESFQLTLSAHVYINVGEITDELENYRFVWKRMSQDSIGDAAWNAQSKAIGHKTVDLNNDDVYGRSVFVCEVDLEDYEYTGD